MAPVMQGCAHYLLSATQQGQKLMDDHMVRKFIETELPLWSEGWHLEK